MDIATKSARVDAAQREAFDRLLKDHMLYCTVCDNNNGNRPIHNTTRMLGVDHQKIPFTPKPYEVDATNPFYRYDPARAKTEKPLGPIGLAGKALNPDTRRAPTLLTTLPESLGKSLGPAKSGEAH
jgi:hypothetical protein